MTFTGVTLHGLKAAITTAGGGANAIVDAEALYAKIALIARDPRTLPLLPQLMRARDPGDFRGRVLEVNVAACFAYKGIHPDCGVKQNGRAGDIDFMFKVDDWRVYLELKHLGQDQQSQAAITAQIEATNRYCIQVADSLRDVFRLQRDIIGKASTRKFNPSPAEDAINLVAIDVSELQFGAVDLCDCLLAAGGNSLAGRHCHESCLDEGVVGVFEQIPEGNRSASQIRWIADCHRLPHDVPHPRDYLHGVVFLFRDRTETAALSYGLRAAVAWNAMLVPEAMARAVSSELYEVMPQAY